jgi:multicomponent Na+:H+ antiporter subunit F
MTLMLVRLFAGPSLYDRVLAVNSFGTKTVLFLAVFALWIGRPDAIDIAILYALINFVATIAILKFFRFRAFNLALARTYVSAIENAPTADDAASKSGADESK